MTSMYASPQQPAMTSMYAAPPGYAQAAPAMTSMYMSPTTMAPSMVPAPMAAPMVTSAAPASAFGSGAPATFNMAPPTKLTEGMEYMDHATVNKARIAYEKALDAQLAKQSKAILQEAKIKKQYMEVESRKRIDEFNLQTDEQVKMSGMRLDQEAQLHICGLEEAAITQRTQKEEAGAIATADYVKKKALEDFNMNSYQLQKHWHEKEQKASEDYKAAVARGQAAGVF